MRAFDSIDYHNEMNSGTIGTIVTVDVIITDKQTVL